MRNHDRSALWRATVRLGAVALSVAMLAIAAAPLARAQNAAPAQPAAQSGPRVAGIVVTGNRRIEPATVASYLTLGVGDPITSDALNDSVRRLFDTGLFSDAAVTVDQNRIVVRVTENPTINEIAFEGNSVIADDLLLSNIATRPRRAFTRARAEADAQVITDIYRRSGRYGAMVEPVIIELPENRVNLVFEIEEGDITGVNSISFVGNDVFSDRRLRQIIQTSESGLFSLFISSDIYDPDRLEADKELLRKFYLSRGYADFSVLSAVAELAPDRDGFFITFTISEGPLYAFGEQTVSTSAPGLDPAAFEALIQGAPGETYDADVIDSNIDRMVFLAGQEGFAFIQVRPRAVRNETDRVIDVVYELVEGPRVFVERIDIEGNTRTLDRVIRRQFDIVEGDAFNSREIDKARRRIRSLGFFANVNVATERGTTDDRANVRVSVEEQPTGSISFGVGFSTGDGPIGNVSITERNFLGRGQLVRANLAVAGKRSAVDLSFREPAFLDRDLSAGFDIFARREDLSSESSFEQTNIGFSPVVGFPLSENGDLSLKYSISDDKIRNVSVNASPLIKADEGSAITSLVGYQYAFDRRNDRLEPTQGFIAKFGQDFAGLGGDAQYVRTSGSVKGFTSFFNEDVIVSIEGEAGNVTSFGEDLRITDRFFLGGDRFRGFASSGIGPRDFVADDSLGGKNFGVIRSDVSFPIGLPEELGIFGGVFADVGTLWGLDRTSAGGVSVDDDPKLRASIGASIFWDSGFGPLRVNFAIPVVKQDGDETEAFRLTAATRF